MHVALRRNGGCESAQPYARKDRESFLCRRDRQRKDSRNGPRVERQVAGKEPASRTSIPTRRVGRGRRTWVLCHWSSARIPSQRLACIQQLLALVFALPPAPSLSPACVNPRDLQVCLHRSASTALNATTTPPTTPSALRRPPRTRISNATIMPRTRHALLLALALLALLVREGQAFFGLHPKGQVGDPTCNDLRARRFGRMSGSATGGRSPHSSPAGCLPWVHSAR